MGLLKTGATALAITLGALGVSTAANAADHHRWQYGGGGGWNGHHDSHGGWNGHHDDYRGYRGDRFGSGFGFGFGTGALLGGFGSSYGYGPGYGGYAPGYYSYYAPPVYYSRPAYRPVYRARASNWIDYCSSRYRTFNPRTGLYRGNDGRMHQCR